MISEIAWLMEAFLEEDYKTLRKKIQKRMAEVTESYSIPQIGSARPQHTPNVVPLSQDPIIAKQSPSMQRIMMENPELIPKIAPPVTPAAAAALQARQALIQKSVKGEAEPGRKSPRKF